MVWADRAGRRSVVKLWKGYFGKRTFVLALAVLESFSNSPFLLLLLLFRCQIVLAS